MIKIYNDIQLNAPADVAWEILANRFGDVSLWLSSLESSYLDGQLAPGAKRVCHTRAIGPFKGGKITEELISFQPELRVFSYKVINGLPSFFKSAINSWTVESLGKDQCIMKSRSHIEAAWTIKPIQWLFPLMLKKTILVAMEELQHRIEKGEVHPRKLALDA